MMRCMFVPIALIMDKAMRLCKFHFSIAMAIMKPPKYKKTNLCPYEAVVSLKDKPPEMGKSTIGKRAAVAIGTASVIHHTADPKCSG